MKNLVTLLLIVLFAGLVSCSKSKVPRGVLPVEKMQEVYWDYLRADIYANETVRNDSSRDAAKENLKLQEKIFAKHKLSTKEFYKSYDYYLKHPVMMTRMLDTMTVRQQKKLDLIKAQKAAEDSAAAKRLQKQVKQL